MRYRLRVRKKAIEPTMRAPMIALTTMPASAPLDRAVEGLMMGVSEGGGEMDDVCDVVGEGIVLELPTAVVFDSSFAVLAEEAAEVIDVVCDICDIDEGRIVPEEIEVAEEAVDGTGTKVGAGSNASLSSSHINEDSAS
jgi:hypothetical protein